MIPIDEIEMADHLRSLVIDILYQRERTALYREIYANTHSMGNDHEIAHQQASVAIQNMDLAIQRNTIKGN